MYGQLSHGGNVLFPGWEDIVPKVGINISQAGNIWRKNKIRFSANKAGLLEIKLALLTDNGGVLTKSGPSLPSDGAKPFKQGDLAIFISPVISPISLPNHSHHLSRRYT